MAEESGLSYHYWHAQANSGSAPKATPKKLSAEEAAALDGQGNGAASAWNQAGTWEERNWTKWWTDALTEAVVGLEAPLAKGAGAVRVSGVGKCTGDASVVVVRGKPRHGFDFEVELKWTADVAQPPSTDTKEVKGTLKIAEVSKDTVDDDELVGSVELENKKKAGTGDAARAAQAGAIGMLPEIRKRLVALDRRMRERAESLGGA